jgi:hypothetical protein
VEQQKKLASSSESAVKAAGMAVIPSSFEITQDCAAGHLSVNFHPLMEWMLPQFR